MSERTLLVFDAVCLGLTRCIHTARQDIATCEEQKRQHLLDSKQCKELTEDSLAAARYIKRLEINLGRLEALRHNYSIHLKMSQGSQSLHRAHTLSLSTSFLNRKHKSTSLSQMFGVNSDFADLTHSPQSPSSWLSSTINAGTRIKAKSRLNLSSNSGNNTGTTNSSKAAKLRLKEFLENVDAIETEFKTMMGTFIVDIQNIQGYARICSGDTFEVNIRYGEAPKFKTKIRVLRNNKQKCDQTSALFKACLADAFIIEAYECKGFSKKLLGTKMCEIMDFFSPHTQLLTVNLNQTGSIKLNLIITWNPLHLSDA